MKNKITYLVFFLLLSCSLSAQTKKFLSKKQMFMHETTTEIVSDSTEQKEIIITINYTTKKMSFDYKDGVTRDFNETFVSHEINKQEENISFYFNSKVYKVGVMMFNPAPGIVMQYQDGRIQTYYLSEVLE